MPSEITALNIETMSISDIGRVWNDDTRSSGGAIRASLGLASNLADVVRFLDFAAGFIDRSDVPDDLPAQRAC